nr:unnamed protein product [Callosobruchus chinensis]
MAKKKALTAAERQRRCREKRKNDPEKVAEVKRKDLERYHARKKLVADMSVREHRIMKRKWQQENKKRREKKQLLENVLLNSPPPSPIPELPEGSSSRGRKKVKRDRTKLYRDNIKLQDKIDQLERKVRKYKKRERYKTVKCREEKRLIQSLFQTSITKESRMQTQLVRDSLGVDRPLKYKSVLPKQTDLVRRIHQFFLRDDVTRATAGKKETVTHKKNKVQKRFLLDSMKNLYQAFLRENSSLKCHYSYFTKHRPFYVKPPTVDGRDTCLCKLHANITYVVNVLHKNKVIMQRDTNAVLETLVCTVDSESCMKGVCLECNKRYIVYDERNQAAIVDLRQWVRRSEVVEKAGKTWKISKNIPVTEKLTLKEVIQKFETELQNFKTHVYNIRHQYKAYRQCINGLTESEVALHIDFSENYACKYHSEVQSHHFGGSRNQGTMQVHQMFSETYKILNHRVLSCFCQQFCSCHVPKTYRPLPEAQLSTKEKEDDTIYHALVDITNKIGMPRKSFYDTVYSPDESSDEDQPLAIYKTKEYTNPTAISGTSYQTLQPEDIHPTKIEDGVHVLVKVRSERNIQYTYAGVAKSGVDEEGDVLVMFLKAVDDSGRLFKLVDNDLSDVPFDDLIKILPAPKVIKKGKRQFFEFDEPLSVFEK